MAAQAGDSCRIRLEDTPLRELKSRERATLGGKFTSRCTWLLSPLNSASSASRSAHVASARRDFHHKLSTKVIRDNQVVTVEDLAVRGLARTRPAKSVHDAG